MKKISNLKWFVSSFQWGILSIRTVYALTACTQRNWGQESIIVPRTRSEYKSKLNSSIQEIIEEDVNVVIGPVVQEDIKEVYKYKNITFISPSNINPVSKIM